LLAAAAELFAREGFHATSADAVAEAADRTSGAVYAHFGGKAGLLLELLEQMKAATAQAMGADLERAATVEERVGVLWREFADPPSERGDAWVMLEHELWLYAARNPEAAERLAARYDAERSPLAEELTTWTPLGEPPVRPARESAVLVLALLLGLEMQRRIDPDAVPDDLAVDGITRLVGLRAATTERQTASRAAGTSSKEHTEWT
jgi:AcrR family transcriptional regulator